MSSNSNNEEHLPKKKKVESSKQQSIMEYSFIKLPAHMFIQYLQSSLSHFVDDCLRF